MWFVRWAPNVTGSEKSSPNRDSNSGFLAYRDSALTTELLKPDILTYSHTPVNPVIYSPSCWKVFLEFTSWILGIKELMWNIFLESGRRIFTLSGKCWALTWGIQFVYTALMCYRTNNIPKLAFNAELYCPLHKFRLLGINICNLNFWKGQYHNNKSISLTII